MEHKIGETIILGHRKVKVRRSPTQLLRCGDCAFWMESICGSIKCHKNEREDHTTIYYEETEEE